MTDKTLLLERRIAMTDKILLLERLYELQQEMIANLDEIEELVRDHDEAIYNRSKAYVFAHLRISLSSDHGYLDGSDNLDNLMKAIEVNE